MKKMVKFLTFFMVALSISLLNTNVPDLDYKTNTLSNAEFSVSADDTSSDPVSEDDESDVELYETEFIMHEIASIFTPKTLDLSVQGESHVYIQSYIFSIYVPPLEVAFS